MTITAVADAGGTPPSVDVTVTSGVGTVMSAVALWRNDSSGRSLVRSQPSAGFDERTVTDYECPYGESVTYDWIATYTDPGDYVTVFNELWASLGAWSVSGPAAVSAGTVVNTGAVYVFMSRVVASGRYRLTIESMYADPASTGGASSTRVLLRSGGVYTVSVDVWGGSVRVSAYGSTTVVTALDPTQPITLDMGDDGTVTVTGTGDAVNIPYAYSITEALVQLPSGYAGAVGALHLQSYPAPDDIAETSDPVTLDAVDAWLIHPGTPGLSIPIIENSNDTATRLVEIGDVENATNATIHRILGSATPIPTTTGPRSDDTSTLTIETVTTDEAAAVRALLASDIPILIQIPPDWDLDFNCGFYQVGNVRTSRSDPIINAYRTFTLPLTKVQSPVVDVENTGWSYAAVAAEFATYSALMVTFATYADLASDTRS